MINQLNTNFIKLTSMKKILLLAAVLVSSVVANATTWRINSNEAAKADFLSVTEAAAANKVHRFDTLYVEAGIYQGTHTIAKPCLTIIGPGWEIPTNYGSTSTSSAAYFTDQLSILADSTTIESLFVTHMYLQNVKNVIVERCMIRWMDSGTSSAYKLEDITIRNNFFRNDIDRQAAAISLTYSYSVLNISIENNIFVEEYFNPDSPYGHKNVIIMDAYNSANTSGLIAHNTIYRKFGTIDDSFIRAYNTVIRDNIVINRSTYYDLNAQDWLNYESIKTCEVYNNVFSIAAENVSADMMAHFPSNQYIGATAANTFTCTILNNSEETYYQLKEGSVAANKAYQGEDCGAYAGAWPFVVNGRPRGIPYIFDVYAPNYPTDNLLNISFKVKANNQ